MARVNVEQKAFVDPRVRRLAKLMGVDFFSAIGRLASLWMHCTETGKDVIENDLVDIAMGHDDAAENLVTAGLGENVNGTHVRVKGAEGRTEWLAGMRDGKVAGGRARAKTAKRNSSGKFEPAKPAATSSPPAEVQQAKPGPSSPLALSPAPAPALKSDSLRSSCRAGPPDDVHKVVQYLNEKSGRGFTAKGKGGKWTATGELIRKRLKQGYTERDLRLVAWHRSTEWGDDPAMQKFLRPTTLWGTAKLDEYLDDARQALDERKRTETEQIRPEQVSEIFAGLGVGSSR